MPIGLGARQLHDWYDDLDILPMGALLIQPTTIESSSMRLLLIAGPEGRSRWSDREKLLAAGLADYVAQTISNNDAYAQAMHRAPIPSAPLELETPVSGRIIALEEEQKQLVAELETTKSRLQRAEVQAVESSTRARDLAASDRRAQVPQGRRALLRPLYLQRGAA